MTIEQKVIKAQELLVEILAELNANKGDVKKIKGRLEGLDDLYKEAKSTVLNSGKATTSLLQRRMGVSYKRAVHLIGLLEKGGVVGPARGSAARLVKGKKNNNDVTKDSDDLYEEAKQIVVAAGKASASLLQRRLQIGYGRAAKLMDILEAKGIIGAYGGAASRKILTKLKKLA